MMMKSTLVDLRLTLSGIRNDLRLAFFRYKGGGQCSKSGRDYEERCWANVRDHPTSTRLSGGSGHGNDLLFEWGDVEVKKAFAPDWGQEKLKWTNGGWSGKFPGLDAIRIPELPPGLTKEALATLRRDNPDYRDQYIDVDDTCIQKYYRAKGNHYIQISDGFGLYHLGEDVYDLGVPEFTVKQKMRVRVKYHSAKNFSVTCAFQPVNIRKMPRSPYSLDDIDRLPPKLKVSHESTFKKDEIAPSVSWWKDEGV